MEKLTCRIPFQYPLILCLILSLLLLTGSLMAATYYVKPTGNNSNSGLTEALAWKTVQKGLTTALAGDTVFIRAGTYDEASSVNTSIWGRAVNAGFAPTHAGTAGNYIVFKGYPGDERPVILGKSNAGTPDNTFRCAAGFQGGAAYIVFDSLHFHKGYGGIHFRGSGDNIHDIIIRNCIIDSTLGMDVDYGGDNNNGGIFTYVDSYDGGATDGAPAVRNITVEGCEIFANGNWVGGSPQYMAFNSSGFHMYGCDSCLIRNNIVHNQEAGIHMKHSARFTEVYGNIIYNCSATAMWDRHTGSYSSLGYAGPWIVGTRWHNNIAYNNGSCFMIGVGSTLSTRDDSLTYFYNNTCDCAGSSSWGQPIYGGIVSQWGLQNRNFFFNNIIYNAPSAGYAASDDHHGAFSWSNSSSMGNPTNIYEDYNMYHGAGANGNYYIWGSTQYNITSWRAANPSGVLAGHGANSRYGDPLFVNAAAHDYRLQAGSPALTGGKGGSFTFYPGTGKALTVTLPTYLGALGTSGPPDSSISVTAAPTVVEGSSLVFPITIGTSFGSNCVITYSTVNGTAVAPGDFTATVNGQVTITAGFTTGSIVVPTINDSEIEATENMSVIILGASIGNLGLTTASGSITDNDVAPRQQIPFSTLPGRSLTVSDTYSGYTTAPIADNVIDPNGAAATTWASGEDNAIAHWVDLSFGQQISVNGVTVHWAYNSVHSDYTTSVQYRIQRWNGSAYVDITTVNNASQSASTDTSFPPTTTDRIRIYQPAGQGPSDYTSIMWLTEVQLWGPQDTIPPAAVTDLR